jgi:hypothetical protein
VPFPELTITKINFVFGWAVWVDFVECTGGLGERRGYCANNSPTQRIRMLLAYALLWKKGLQ